MSIFRVSPPLLLRALLLLVPAAIFAACSSGDDNGGTDPGDVFNRPPTVSQIEWANAYQYYVEGDAITLAVVASDADGDSLQYSWDWATPEPAGSYNNDDTDEVVVTVGSTPGQYQARVSVTDGRSNPSQRVVGISVGNRLAGGEITGTVTLPETELPYVLVRDATVMNGATLVVQAGAEIQVRQRFSGGTILNQGIIVEGAGTLRFDGTGASPVVLRGNRATASATPTHKGIEVDHVGNVQLTNFRILDATIGVLKRGAGTALIEAGTIRSCGTGILGLSQLGSVPSTLTVTGVEVSDCSADGVSLASSNGSFERLMVRNCGAVGFKMTGSNGSSSAVLTRCELDANEGGNLALDLGSTVDLGCSNLLPAESGYNVVFLKSGAPVAGVLPMVNCYWGIAAPLSQEDIRDRTFDPSGRVSDTTWARESDLSGYRGSAINFDDVGDACNP